MPVELPVLVLVSLTVLGACAAALPLDPAAPAPAAAAPGEEGAAARDPRLRARRSRFLSTLSLDNEQERKVICHHLCR